ncbi:MAG: hypothetical protein U5J62_06435 [Desulfurivibrio sp.]|nr:hypothetical protein [Desulfurivibrio sp.]
MIADLPAADYRRLLTADPAVIDIVEVSPGQPTPVLAAYDDGPGHHHLRVWCPHCATWHVHGRGGPGAPPQRGREGCAGDRVAHCTTANSPYRRSGYILDVIGPTSSAPRRRARKTPWCHSCRHHYSAALARCSCGRHHRHHPLYPALAAVYAEILAGQQK